MIDTTILPLFIVTTIFLAISPGPDLVLISTYSSTRGFKAGVMVSVGIFIAGLIQTLLVAFGLGKLMQAMPPLVLVIKIVGAIYLSWLGVNLLRTWLKNKGDVSASQTIQSLGNKDLVYRGLLNNIMNPKALIFFSMFLLSPCSLLTVFLLRSDSLFALFVPSSYCTLTLFVDLLIFCGF